MALATVKSSRSLNEHVRADEDDTNVHFPKGFLAGLGGTNAFKDNSGNIAWAQRGKLSSILDEVDGLSAPPTEVDGDEYILNIASIVFDVDTILFQSDNTIRYTFNGAPDLSSLVVNDHARIRLAGNAINNGTFIITAINDGSDFIEVTNTARADDVADEASDSTATATTTHRDWDEAGDTDHVVFFSQFGKWFAVTPLVGTTAFNEALNTERIFKATGWESAGGGTIGGSIAVDQISFGSGVDAIQGTSLFVFDGTKLGVGIASPTATGHFKGVGATSATFAGKFDNSAGSPILYIRDNQTVGIGITTLKAIAYKAGMDDSDVVSGVYAIEKAWREEIEFDSPITLEIEFDSPITKEIEFESPITLEIEFDSEVDHG